MIFVDTNYFLRFLLKDDQNQHQQAKKLFRDAALGKIKLFTSLIVFFEIYWVLLSFYHKDKASVINTLEEILSLSFIKIKERRLLGSALEIYKGTNLDLEDSYNLIYAKQLKIKTLATFDKDLQKAFKGKLIKV